MIGSYKFPLTRRPSLSFTTCTHNFPTNAKASFARLRESQSHPADHPTACRDFIEALELCHTSTWRRLTGCCNEQKSALIQCLRKEVSTQAPPHPGHLDVLHRAASARVATALRPKSSGSRPNKCGKNCMKTISPPPGRNCLTRPSQMFIAFLTLHLVEEQFGNLVSNICQNGI